MLQLLDKVFGMTRASRLEVPAERNAELAATGMIRSVEYIGGYPAIVLRLMIWWQGLSEAIPTRYGISMYRVEYWTTGAAGERTYASGLITFPRHDSLRGVVSYQHGTAVQRAESPSAPNRQNGVLASAVFAGHGYLMVAPDYLGLGTSVGPHPYLHAETEARAVIDLLRAARQVVTATGFTWPTPLFLTGFSQGGHATLAAQRALEAAPVEGLRVTGAAPVAGPYDLSAISFPSALGGPARADSLYLAYMVGSYARLYEMPLSSVMREPYAEKFSVLFDGAHDGEEVIAALPSHPREMFRSEFLNAYDSRKETWLLQRLAENSLNGWSPRAPIRLYYGTRDVDVSPEEAHVEAERLSARGGDVRAISVGDFDHDGSVVAAIPGIRAWFDQLTADK